LAFQRLAKPKISDLDTTIVEQNVVRFDIPMHDVAAGENLESLHHLPEEIKCSLFREGTFLLHEFIHSAAVAILIDKVEIIGSFEHVDVLDDVGTVLEGGKNVDFVDRAFLEFGDLFEFFSLNHLYCNLLLGHQMNCFVHFGVNSLPQMLLKLVVLYYLPHHQ
jgi:hypothetical protein